jgi:hypothetical protein
MRPSLYGVFFCLNLETCVTTLGVPQRESVSKNCNISGGGFVSAGEPSPDTAKIVPSLSTLPLKSHP